MEELIEQLLHSLKDLETKVARDIKLANKKIDWLADNVESMILENKNKLEDNYRVLECGLNCVKKTLDENDKKMCNIESSLENLSHELTNMNEDMKDVDKKQKFFGRNTELIQA